MGKYTSHIRIPVSLFKNDIFLGLAGRNKTDCLAILVVLLRYSNQKTGECYPRLALMHSLLGISNPVLMVGSSQGDRSDTSGGLIGAVRLTGISKDNFSIYLNKNNSNNKMDNDKRVDDIINKYKNDKVVLIGTLYSFLNSLPPADTNKLLNNPTYKWYMKLVLDYKQQELRQKKLLPEVIAKQKITEALQSNGKQSSERYVARVKYNKANGIKPWEMKKNKF